LGEFIFGVWNIVKKSYQLQLIFIRKGSRSSDFVESELKCRTDKSEF
jgi:hypothetical protein